MVERFIAPVLKTGELKRFRGFESRSLRHLPRIDGLVTGVVGYKVCQIQRKLRHTEIGRFTRSVSQQFLALRVPL
jgi:hypothetical protein